MYNPVPSQSLHITRSHKSQPTTPDKGALLSVTVFLLAFDIVFVVQGFEAFTGSHDTLSMTLFVKVTRFILQSQPK